MTPQLLHLPCSHLITACRDRGLCFKSPTYLSAYYARSNTINIWESSFEPYLNPSQWPEYKGLEYVSDASLLKPKKGRRRKKRLKGDMDESQGRASADYGTGDFDEDRRQNRCSKCHRFCSHCKCKKKKNLNEKERPQQALERGLGISHGEKYSSLCLAQILIYTYSVLLIIISWVSLGLYFFLILIEF